MATTFPQACGAPRVVRPRTEVLPDRLMTAEIEPEDGPPPVKVSKFSSILNA